MLHPIFRGYLSQLQISSLCNARWSGFSYVPDIHNEHVSFTVACPWCNPWHELLLLSAPVACPIAVRNLQRCLILYFTRSWRPFLLITNLWCLKHLRAVFMVSLHIQCRPTWPIISCHWGTSQWTWHINQTTCKMDQCRNNILSKTICLTVWLSIRLSVQPSVCPRWPSVTSSTGMAHRHMVLSLHQ